MKKILIIKIIAQYVSFLTDFLLNKSYKFIVIRLRDSLSNSDRINFLCQEPHKIDQKTIQYYCYLTDTTLLTRIVKETQTGQNYNFFFKKSCRSCLEEPKYTSNLNAIGII